MLQLLAGARNGHGEGWRVQPGAPQACTPTRDTCREEQLCIYQYWRRPLAPMRYAQATHQLGHLEHEVVEGGLFDLQGDSGWGVGMGMGMGATRQAMTRQSCQARAERLADGSRCHAAVTGLNTGAVCCGGTEGVS